MDSAYIHILGTTYKAGLPLALFSGILKNCDSFLQIKYGNVRSGVQSKNSQNLEETLFQNYCFPKRYPFLVLILIPLQSKLKPRASVDKKCHRYCQASNVELPVTISFFNVDQVLKTTIQIRELRFPSKCCAFSRTILA